MKTLFVSLSIGLFMLLSCKDEKQPEIPNEIVKKQAFKNHSDSIPKDRKDFFVLNADYPRKRPDVGFKYMHEFNQAITVQNAGSYVSKLKEYASPLINRFINEKDKFSAKEVGWFHEPWMGSKRDPIMGTYTGNPNGKGTFKHVDKDQEGFVLVMYDPLAAFTVGEVFDSNGNVPMKIDPSYFKGSKPIDSLITIDLSKDKGQFKEGAVIVKFAFSALNGDEWDDMKDAPLFTIYNKLNKQPKYGYHNVSLFQIDVVVKDSKSAPDTGWVFTTFVYDKNIKSNNVLDKFVPLGAIWGNDPDVVTDFTSVEVQNPKLKQTWINNNAPYYSRETLGWGGRLSGPNDGAVALQTSVVVKDKNKKDSVVQYARLPMTSCMSCHLPSQQRFSSFLLPSPNGGRAFFNYNTPAFLRYDRNLKGESFDKGQYSFDYNMAMNYKAMRAYLAFLNTYYKGKNEKVLKSNMVEQEDDFEEYRMRKIDQ
ncbi:hypothetical protein F3J23_01805 [Chryseobacterium sp. Tr-659]|uniref:cytochrome P460 family protein n=1 Tax=Chryseobacterium sp. Tr-659 TaxID=2608340 RepID=UPI00141DA45A|nr:cytochrome P460 family protein [Chryseobacterium sp. Tr-659]NIF04161.1 hypothetical protein [Chryseobacterium sp. Tr-659]